MKSKKVSYFALFYFLTMAMSGLKRRITAQMLRHSFATHLYEAGVPVEHITEMMGHGHRTETTRYIHVTIPASQRLLNAHAIVYNYRFNHGVCFR